MCTNPLWLNSDEVSHLHTFEYKIKEIKKGVKKEGDMIQLTGGEPTIHPEFFKLFFWARENYPKLRIYLITNGRMFFYEDFTKRVLIADRLTIQVSLLAHKKEIHDKITGVPKSHDQVVQGIRNILKYKKDGQKLEIRVVLTKINFSFLNEILGFVYNEFKGVDSVTIIFPEIEGKCAINFDKIGLMHSDVRDLVDKVIPKWVSKIEDLRLYHFPLCQIGSHLWKYVYRTLPPEEVAYIKKCNDCKYRDYCLGIHKGYLEKIGDHEFMPIKEDILIKMGDDFKRPII